MRKMKPSHPGELLAEQIEFLGLKISATAAALDISRQHLHRILKCEVPVTKETGVRLGHMFGNGARLWLAMQADYDAWTGEATIDVSKVPVYI